MLAERDSGADEWAARIERMPDGNDTSILSPQWRDAWDYARAVGFLARVANRAAVQTLTNERNQ